MSPGLFLRRGALCALVWSVCGCQPTNLRLHVRTLGEADMTGTRVRLLIGEQSRCGDGVLFADRTDREGALIIHTPACGAMRLVVERPGLRPLARKVDTCQISRLDVELAPLPPPPAPSQPCQKAVYDFMQARARRDGDSARALWLHPDEVSREALGPTVAVPLSSDYVEEGTITGDVCRVRATSLLERGCQITWRFELAQSGGTWRIRSADEAPAAEPSPQP